MNILTQAQLRSVLSVPDADAHAAAWLTPLNAAMQACAIDSAVRQAAFLAQVLLESGQLQRLQEALGYSAQRLCQVWPKHFPDDASAAPYSHNPEQLANHIYALRLGNGDAGSGDGWAFRGRGLIQLTGRDNYTAFAHAMGIDAVANPDLLQQPHGAALSAAWFWRKNGLNELADKTADADGHLHFVELTKRINGGTNGLAERESYWQQARVALGVTAA